VAAAGNEGSSRGSFPAAYANVFSVSAVDSQGEITAYSNRGATIDLAAPGGDGSRDINGDGYPDGVLSTGAADGDFAYTFLSGTSMAAPHVAGVFALMKAVNPALTAADVERLLEAGALTDDLGAAGRDDLYGHGLIDARRAVDAALVEAGGASSLPSRLASSTSALNFGNTRDVLEFTLVNGGSGALTVLEVFADRPWLTVEALDTDGAGLGRYRVLAERTTLDPGLYEATITARSDSNLVTLRVLLTVAEETQAEIGILYLLVYDPTTDQVVAQTAVRNSAAGYRFSLPEVPIGEYLVFAGTDLDNDRLICDPGEACGAFLTIEQPVALEVNADRDDIVFPIEYLIALPGSADTSGRRPAPTLEREEINP
jgi:serine protease